jgi:hypothetical protein
MLSESAKAGGARLSVEIVDSAAVALRPAELRLQVIVNVDLIVKFAVHAGVSSGVMFAGRPRRRARLWAAVTGCGAAPERARGDQRHRGHRSAPHVLTTTRGSNLANASGLRAAWVPGKTD